MMNLNLHLKICGGLLVGLASLHLVFPKRFHWKEELERLSLLNRQIFWVHCLFIGLVVLQFGVLSLWFTDTLLTRSSLAKVVLSGLVIFWGARLFVQHFVYSPKLWRGHRFNTFAHLLFTGLWMYLVAVYGAALWRQFND